MKTDLLRVLVFDEADEILKRGFLENVNHIIQTIPPNAQLCLFSATMPPEIQKMSESIMKDPAIILVKKENLTLQGIKQYYISCSSDEVKFDNLIEIFCHVEVNQCIIYCNTVEKANLLTEKMREKKFMVGCIHSKLTQEERFKILEAFRLGSTRILVTTDLLSRGIDVYQVSMVINFELPLQKESYIHRIGRSGRFGRRGIAINLISKIEADLLIRIEEFYSTEIMICPTDVSDMEA